MIEPTIIDHTHIFTYQLLRNVLFSHKLVLLEYGLANYSLQAKSGPQGF